jgi:hypothetical protein
LSTIGKQCAAYTVDEISFYEGIATDYGTYASVMKHHIHLPLASMQIPASLRRAPQEVEHSTAPLVWRPTGISAATSARHHHWSAA